MNDIYSMTHGKQFYLTGSLRVDSLLHLKSLCVSEREGGGRVCLALRASLFTAGTNHNAGLTKISTDKKREQ